MSKVDERTNASCEPIDIPVNSYDDFVRLREAFFQAPAVPKIIDQSDAAHLISFPGQEIRLLVSGEESAGQMAVFESVIHPGFGAPAHHQRHEAEWWYMLEGEMTIAIGNQTKIVKAGASAFAPAGATHAFLNHTDKPVRLLVINSPAGHERFFAALEHASQIGDSEMRREQLIAHDVYFHEGVIFDANQELQPTLPD